MSSEKEKTWEIPYGPESGFTVEVAEWWGWAIQLELDESLRDMAAVPLNADDADALGDALKAAAAHLREVQGDE